MNERARVAVPIVLVALLGVLVWKSLVRDPRTPQIEACRFALQSEFDQEVAIWRARTRGEDPPERDPESRGEAFRACAPLHQEPACRDAWIGATAEGFAAERMQRVATVCRDAYCPKLPEPKPSMCERFGKTPSENAELLQDFDDAVLRLELGPSAEPIVETRKRGIRDLRAVLADYFDAGSPEWQGEHARVRALPKAPSETPDANAP